MEHLWDSPHVEATQNPQVPPVHTSLGIVATAGSPGHSQRSRLPHHKLNQQKQNTTGKAYESESEMLELL